MRAIRSPPPPGSGGWELWGESGNATRAMGYGTDVRGEHMFATLANPPRKDNDTAKGLATSMATQQSKNSKSSAKAGVTKAKSGAKQAKSGVKQTVGAEKNQAQSVAEAAVDLPVGAVLRVTDRV